MTSFTQRFSEGNFVAGGLHSVNRVAGVYQTPWLDMSEFHRAYFLINVGVMAATATLDAIVQEATDNTGTGVQAIAGKAITQLTQAGGDGNDWLIMELRAEEMDENNAYDNVRAQLTIANAAVLCSVWVFGTVSRFPPVSVANVTEIID